MIVGIDVRLAAKHLRGIGRYVSRLVNELVLIDTENQYFLYSDRIDAKGQLPKASNFRLKVFGPPAYPVWEQAFLPLQAAKDKLDVLHSPANTCPLMLLGKTRIAVTVHDLTFLKPPRIVPTEMTLYQHLGKAYRQLTARLGRACVNMYLADSYATARDLRQMLKIPCRRIRVVHLGIDDSESPDSDLSLKKPYIFHVGGAAPSKNTARMIKAFAALPRPFSKYNLAIAGVKESRQKQFRLMTQELGLGDRIVLLPYLSESQMSQAYSHASLVVMPSLYEGFGFPVLEAMKAGAPVVAANTSSLPEVGGDACRYVNPYSTSDMASVIANVLSDSALRTEMIEKGLRQTENFSWHETARRTLDVYRELALVAR